MIRTGDTVLDWCNRYIRARALGAGAAYQVRRAVELFVAWCGKAPDVSDVDEDSLSEWIAWLESTHAPRSRRNHRANILAVLRFAADGQARDEPNARRISVVKVPPPDPRAWSDGQLAAFFDAAALLEGRCKYRPGVSRAAYLLALAGAAYDTGLRRGDLWRIRHEWIQGDGSIRLRQNKTSEPHLCAVTPHVVSLIASIPYAEPLKWTGHGSGYSALWREACKRAGIPHGCTQQVRRTAATVVWEEHPEAVQRFLGHRTATMWRHYVDQSRSAKAILPRRKFFKA